MTFWYTISCKLCVLCMAWYIISFRFWYTKLCIHKPHTKCKPPLFVYISIILYAYMVHLHFHILFRIAEYDGISLFSIFFFGYNGFKEYGCIIFVCRLDISNIPFHLHRNIHYILSNFLVKFGTYFHWNMIFKQKYSI